MYFKRLELIGFKSFYNKTTLQFEPGITAIVGPNGCGKSNIFDAIRWVLGEQSAKSLRGSEMQDVIFNGTDAQEPLGMAEVTLAFDNRNRFLGFEHDEVAITRRLFRSGESEYLLNKTPVRLKDILDLLLGTGIGAESYSIVAQGKIDLVLSSRPEDRRLVFDEASGITKYKAQKREALRKLEETEQNLLRVNDIITEVKRQIGSLERQASKARRYKEVFEELTQKEILAAALQKKELLQKKDELISQLTQLQAEEAGLLGALKEAETQMAGRQDELRSLEAQMMAVKNQILNQDNQLARNQQHTSFNQERISELARTKEYLQSQLAQAQEKVVSDEAKLAEVRAQYDSIRSQIEEKTKCLLAKEEELAAVTRQMEQSLGTIAESKKGILELELRIASTRNEITDCAAKEQMYQARQKRLALERAKVHEEKAATDMNLQELTAQVSALNLQLTELKGQMDSLQRDSESAKASLEQMAAELTECEHTKLSLESHREFLLRLKTKYEDISESLNATIYLDRLPEERMTGLVVRVTRIEEEGCKCLGEAKPFELDTGKIDEQIQQTMARISELTGARDGQARRLEELAQALQACQQQLRTQELAMANKETSRQTIEAQCSRLTEEVAVIDSELAELSQEQQALSGRANQSKDALLQLQAKDDAYKAAIVEAEDQISQEGQRKEELVMVIARLKAEREALQRRITSDEATLRLLEETFHQDQEALVNLQRQISEADTKAVSLTQEIQDLGVRTSTLLVQIQEAKKELETYEAAYRKINQDTVEVVRKIDDDRHRLDALKDALHDLQMENQEFDFTYQALRERMAQSYKVDVESLETVTPEGDGPALTAEIARLKEKLASYGNVNLVAIEEYDELKKRYDFLVQQQTDLVTAKESLHEAVLKINRTTKKLFLETFEKVKEEFRNYFRLLFNGGDAQVYLSDEQDPLESGIEIICRPPGKKLQNVLLLSGGEKSLSAIALIFAIFKVKPSPFCVLDEIDAALDEANVERFGRALQEFARHSQFIVVTHNKRTIANADVMYGITMEQSGVSKIVSVKFGQQRTQEEPQPDAAEPVPA